MTIPRISPYRLPTGDELPAAQVPWTFDASRAVLLIHDMQRYFLDFYTAEFDALLSNIAALRELGMPAVYTAQPPGQDPGERGLLTDRWGPGLADRAEIVAPLVPRDQDTVLTKRRYSAFFSTGLAETLTAWGRDQLVITGVYAHIGITATALDSFSHNFQTFVVADAIADFSRDQHLAALNHLAATCAVVTSSGALRGDINIDSVRAQVLALLDEPVDDDEDLVDAGLDSIRVMRLIENWKAAGAEVSFADLAAAPTIRGFYEALVGSR